MSAEAAAESASSPILCKAEGGSRSRLSIQGLAAPFMVLLGPRWSLSNASMVSSSAYGSVMLMKVTA